MFSTAQQKHRRAFRQPRAVAGDANVADPGAMDGHFGPAAAVEPVAGGACGSWRAGCGWWLVG